MAGAYPAMRHSNAFPISGLIDQLWERLDLNQHRHSLNYALLLQRATFPYTRDERVCAGSYPGCPAAGVTKYDQAARFLPAQSGIFMAAYLYPAHRKRLRNFAKNRYRNNYSIVLINFRLRRIVVRFPSAETCADGADLRRFQPMRFRP